MRIFVVEDEELIRRELKVLLENASYQVVLAESFEKVPEQVYAFQPDLVLLDVNLPGVSGFDICTRIREKQDVPIIFLTSRTDSMDELKVSCGEGTTTLPSLIRHRCCLLGLRQC